MPQYKYLIVGGGMTADAAVQGIRQTDREGSIGLIGSESKPPYNRPPLTKGLWKGSRFESIWRKAAVHDATLHLGRTARASVPGEQLRYGRPGDRILLRETPASHRRHSPPASGRRSRRHLPSHRGRLLAAPAPR